VAFVIGVVGAQAYARLASAYYEAVTRLVAMDSAWKILDVSVVQDESSKTAVVRLTAEVRRRAGDAMPAARVASRVHVGEVIETPLVFWTLVLLWPVAAARHRVLALIVAIPVFLALEAVTTGCQLLRPLAEASALLAGESDPLTAWERWSRFLEAGGRFVLEVSAALAVVALTRPRGAVGLRSPSVQEPV
jgi:hypothetical protein